MPAEITMPQLSDTMTEGTLVKWHRKEGDEVKEGEEIAEIETDKATMPMESFDAGTLAHIAAKEGEKVKVGELIAVIATAGEDAAEVKKQYEGKGGKPARGQAVAEPEPAQKPERTEAKKEDRKPAEARAETASRREPPKPKRYDYDLIVIGGGPAGYAAAIRAGQLKKRVLCIEKENLGGTCLNWGCIPTKALLEDGAFIRKLRDEAEHRGVKVKGMEVDFSKLVGRSRGIADKLKNGIGHLFRKYEVKHEMGTGQLLGAHRVKLNAKNGGKEFTAEHVILAVGARATQIPGMEFDGKRVIAYREAMTLPKQPKRMAIIGAGAIGCEFADFYSSIGTEVTIVEMLDHLLPNEDDDVSIMLERLFKKRGIEVHTKTKTEKLEKSGSGVKVHLSGGKAIEADVCLVAVGVTPNTDGVAAEDAGLEMEKGRIKVDPQYRTSVENVWAVGDCIMLHVPEQEAMGGYRHPDLAHVAHHEAVYCVERMFEVSEHEIDYRFIPGCTYTHPQVASMGLTEKKAKEQKKQIKVGKFPFSISGRALAAGETDGFVKLIFDAKYGELLGVHMIGENVTELLAEMVLARKLEATEAEIIESMHPHPTMSEAIMEAAGVSDGRAIHL
jgi:dihydrolipoamide dehydrogenase